MLTKSWMPQASWAILGMTLAFQHAQRRPDIIPHDSLSNSPCLPPLAALQSLRRQSASTESGDEADTSLARGFRRQIVEQLRPLPLSHVDLDTSDCRTTSLLTGRLASSHSPYVGASCKARETRRLLFAWFSALLRRRKVRAQQHRPAATDTFLASLHVIHCPYTCL